jgi:hypothetical protein
MKETITLNTQEQKRVMVLNRLLVGQLTAAEAAVLLNLSERQVRRLYAAYPRFKRSLTAKDLAEVYTPTPGERFLACVDYPLGVKLSGIVKGDRP